MWNKILSLAQLPVFPTWLLTRELLKAGLTDTAEENTDGKSGSHTLDYRGFSFFLSIVYIALLWILLKHSVLWQKYLTTTPVLSFCWVSLPDSMHFHNLKPRLFLVYIGVESHVSSFIFRGSNIRQIDGIAEKHIFHTFHLNTVF